ncbi:RHS repeat-associated core domain-containing protein [Pseudidiomarina sp. GXY010]|uniref:RHS repeat-associated core domain-containing protein n=1 Tax=Pseudidiomarina fusca TaxID=2965078 RepID=A0ABU3KXS1_9GAMM|nr:RHS repeat-associated core domain-containing protein [Pseudidiomarina sp. GXY010]
MAGNGDTRYYLYSQSGQLLLSEDNGVQTNYNYLGNRLIAEDRQATSTFINTVRLGSPVARITSAGRVESRRQYQPFGDTYEAPSDDIGYTGHKYDNDLGLSYMQARYYDPVVGRFYSNDPVGFKDIHSFNRYAYANNNPYKYVDPDGREVSVAANLQKDYNAAKTYLTSKSSIAKSYFNRIESSRQTVRIERTNGGSESTVGDPVMGDKIDWNPQEGLITSDGSQSPATGLIHEIIHVLVNEAGVPNEQQDQTTILKENAVNSQTGEGTRRDHNDGTVETVSGPTCRSTEDGGEVCG